MVNRFEYTNLRPPATYTQIFHAESFSTLLNVVRTLTIWFLWLTAVVFATTINSNIDRPIFQPCQFQYRQALSYSPVSNFSDIPSGIDRVSIVLFFSIFIRKLWQKDKHSSGLSRTHHLNILTYINVRIINDTPCILRYLYYLCPTSRTPVLWIYRITDYNPLPRMQIHSRYNLYYIDTTEQKTATDGPSW